MRCLRWSEFSGATKPKNISPRKPQVIRFDRLPERLGKDASIATFELAVENLFVRIEIEIAALRSDIFVAPICLRAHNPDCLHPLCEPSAMEMAFIHHRLSRIAHKLGSSL